RKHSSIAGDCLAGYRLLQRQRGHRRARGVAMGAERERVDGFGKLEDGLRQAGDWYRWGPYVSERQWGTVREDYSPDGEAWDYLPHDHARSRAYRWGEDGLAGFCDVHQRLCLGLALWNGRDPILKERAFGLTGPQGNHGEDVKEYWWYLDAIPSHAWNRWRYHYPQEAFPYQELIDVNARRDRYQPEYELLDTGAFDGDKYWPVLVAVERAGIQQLVLGLVAVPAGVDVDQLLVREGLLRVVVPPPVPRVAGHGVQVPPVLLDVLAVVALRAGEPESPLLQDRVAPVPQRQAQA